MRRQWKRAAALRLAPLSSGMMLLFWMMIPGFISGFLTSELCMEALPRIYYIVGEFLGYACSLVMCFVMFRLTCLDNRYTVSGALYLIAVVLTFVTNLWCGDYSNVPPGATLLLALALCLECVAGVIEYTAHADLLDYFDVNFAAKWRRLRIIEATAYVVTGVGMIGLIMVESIALFVIGVLGNIALVVAGFMRYVYLYQTGTTLQAYQGK